MPGAEGYLMTGPGGVPAENVLLIVASPLDGQQTATNASGPAGRP